MESTEPPVIVTSAKKPSKKKLILLIIAGVVLLALVAGGLYYYFSRPKPVTINTDESISGQLDGLSQQDVDRLAGEDIDANGNPARAQAKALALFQKGDYTASAAVYKAIVDTGKASHELYVEYAAALYYGGDKQGGVSAMETAISKVKSSNLSQVEKDSIVRVYNNQLEGYKDEG